MTVAQTVVHMTDQIRMAVGELATGTPAGPLRIGPLPYLIIHVLPWPKGKATGPPVAFTTPPGDFTEDIARLHALIERIGARDPSAEWPSNPVFGKMAGRDWGVLTYRHLDHHLRQFGA